MIDTVITAAQVLSNAYTDTVYTDEIVVTDEAISTVELKYIRPIVGEALYEVLLGGSYSSSVLVSDYIAPAVSLYVREIVNTPSAPASKQGKMRARVMTQRLSDFLDDNETLYPEYDPNSNILKRCRTNGGFVQIL